MAETVQIDIVANDKASGTIGGITNSLGNLAGNSGGGLMAFASNFAASMTIVTGAIAVAGEAFQKAFEYGEIAAGNERLRQSGELLAQSYGESMDTIVEKVKAASMGTVSELDIIRSSNKAMMLGVTGDADKLAELMEIAAFRARAMGISTQQAFDDIARGIGRSSPLILDNLGIVIDSKNTYKEYAESIGKTANELTKQEKTQALLNKVLEEGNAQIEAAGGLVLDNAGRYEKWNAELANTKEYLIEDTLQMSRLADMGADLLKSIREITGEQGLFEFFFKNATGVNALAVALDFMNSRVKSGKEEQEAAVDAANAHGKALEDLGETSADVAQQQEELEKAITNANKTMLSTVERIASENENYAESYNRITEELAKSAQDRADKLQEIDTKYYEDRQALLENSLLTDEERNMRLAELETAHAEKYAEINEQFNESDEKRKEKLVELEEEHTRASNQIIYNLLEQKLAQDGLSNAELEFLLQKGEAWGLYSSTVVDEAKKAIAEADNLAASIDAIPTEKTITLTMIENTQKLIEGITATATGGQRAAGGPVMAGGAYLVGEQGAEIFRPSQSGNIIPNGGAGSGNISVTLNYQPSVALGNQYEAENALLPFILQGIRAAQANGLVPVG